MTSGSRPGEAGPTYPRDSVQSEVGDWWTVSSNRNIERGRLVKAFVPYVSSELRRLVFEGRAEDARDHRRARYKVEPFQMGAPLPEVSLPVAAMPRFRGEDYFAYRGKYRPALVLSLGGPELERALRSGLAHSQTAPTILVAPYFGVDQDGTRAGWPPGLTERVRHAEYPHLIWDKLPIAGPDESILRLDHIFPIPRMYTAYKLTEHRLSDDAMGVVDEWLEWLLCESLDENSFLHLVRQKLMSSG